MLDEMIKTGRIDITITQDLGATAEGRNQGWFGKVVSVSSVPAQQAEVLNRVATALAAYRLEKTRLVQEAHPNVEQAATAYADRMISETHLNYAAENRARHMHPNRWGGWGRIMFQFRTYQQGMIFLLYKNAVDALRGDREALRAFGYVMGVQLATAGLSGIPIMAPGMALAALIYQAFEDDDDEKDLREMMFQGIKSVAGESAAIAVTKGLPAALGLDISQRIGMGDILDPTPYVNERAEGRDMVAAYWMAAAGGAFGSLLANYAEAYKWAQEGDFTRAAALALPKVAADVIRANGLRNDGLVDTRGNPIIDPENVSTQDILQRAIGFTPTRVARAHEQRAAFFQARENRDSARQRIMRDFVDVRRGRGDMSAIQERVREFNSRHPDYRITQSQLVQAWRTRERIQRNMRNGVPIRKQDRELARQLGIE